MARLWALPNGGSFGNKSRHGVSLEIFEVVFIWHLRSVGNLEYFGEKFVFFLEQSHSSDF